ncbi:hypothetical protein NDU88_005488 [Pleurodeles waltl]|uniref:Uncharacterized protein n=1 Tax=Pleurodeles waltl TaxID=8319 RepID=A0AAV7LMX4_PLEWA|nr:hypothetical protein NDU88_005488 [Pleurodeles waltl]
MGQTLTEEPVRQTGKALERWPAPLLVHWAREGLTVDPAPLSTAEWAHDREWSGGAVEQGCQACGPCPEEETEASESCGTPPPHQRRQNATQLGEDCSGPRQEHCWPCAHTHERLECGE